jgi:menaquinone-specific isochorismate synthase
VASDFPETCESLLRDSLARAAASPSTGFASVAMPAPAGRAAKLLGAMRGATALAFGELLGLGEAAALRLDDLDAAAAKRWAAARFGDLGAPDAEAEDLAPSVILCGAAFSPRATGRGRWQGFPALYLTLPRWTYAPSGHQAQATLRFTASREELRAPGATDRWRDELRILLAALDGPPVEALPDGPLEPPPEQSIQQMPLEDWRPLVLAALREIGTGRFRKLVLARSATVAQGTAEPTPSFPTQGFDEAEVFTRLQAAAGCIAFLARFGGATFLGATPERLIELRDRRFRTDALAGTAPPGDSDELLRSGKDAEEHRLVVEAIEGSLRPLCDEIRRPEGPRPLRLRDVVHLHTPLTGQVRDGAHLLDLACALHPTPAVAGLPREAAMDWITAHEPAARGWYAGFIGWFDRRGDGDTRVAIRAGLLDETQAHLFTGAGIVAGSDPEAEYRETAWKQRPFLRSLGLRA